MSRNIRRIIADLEDVPGEALAVALADAVYNLAEASQMGFAFYVSEADKIVIRLRAHGFDIVPSSVRLQKLQTSSDIAIGDGQRKPWYASDVSRNN